MCVYVCVCVWIPISQSIPPPAQAWCVFHLLSALNSSNKVRIFWEHILFQPLNPLFLCPFSTKHDVSESYMMSSLFCLGCGGQRSVVLTNSPGSTWSLTLGEWREEREMMSYLLSPGYIYLLSLPVPYLLFLQTYIQCWVCQGILNLIVTCPWGESSLVGSKQRVWSSMVGIYETSEMGGCIRWGVFLEVVLSELSLKG